MDDPEPASQSVPGASLADTTSGLARAYSWAVVKLRFLVIAAWAVLGVGASLHLSNFGSGGSPVVTLAPGGTPALHTLATSRRLFRVPAQAEFEVVIRDPDGLSAAALKAIAAQAERTDTSRGNAVRFALPVTDTLKLFPGSRESGTTAIVYLAIDPNLSQSAQTQVAAAYARALTRATGETAHPTGPIAGQLRQGTLIDNRLALLEVATLAVILLIVGLAYRSLGAPLIVLASAAVGLVMAVWILERMHSVAGVSVPQELDPVVVALILGLSTDYAVFLLSGTRGRIRQGDDPRTAVRVATAHVAPIALSSALILAGGLLGLLVSSLGLFHDLAPVLALTVGAAFVVSITLVPALLATFGRSAFWPMRLPAAQAAAPTFGPPAHGPVAWLFGRRLSAAAIVVVTAAALVAAAVPLAHLGLGFGQISDLPASTPERQAADAARKGFAAGILSPSTVLVRGSGLASTQQASLYRLQQEIAGQSHVGAVLGPADEPAGGRFGLFVTPGGTAARYVVVFRDDPLGAAGIRDLTRLQDAMPGLARQAGLQNVRFAYAGDTAIADQSIQALQTDMLRVALVVLGINLLLLVLFLRCLLAPVFLLASSVLTVGATLGLTAWVFQDLLGYGQLTYYVPFVVGVLLVCLGSDYNIFVVGRIWQEARIRPVREAVALAAPQASRAIRIAGVTLAASFALLALIPLRSFREMAFALAAGVLIETFVVRALLAPALIALFGEWSIWPRHRDLAAPTVGSRREPDPGQGAFAGQGTRVSGVHERS